MRVLVPFSFCVITVVCFGHQERVSAVLMSRVFCYTVDKIAETTGTDQAGTVLQKTYFSLLPGVTSDNFSISVFECRAGDCTIMFERETQKLNVFFCSMFLSMVE